MERLAASQTERDVVIARGTDAIEYLQSQLTQDVDALALGESAWTFLLTPKSEVVVLARVTKAADEMVLLDVEEGFGATIAERIDGLLFRTDVSFETTTWTSVSYRGTGSQQIESPGAPIRMETPWPGDDGLDVVGPDVTPDSSAELISTEELDSLRIRVGWPAMADFDDKTTPAMTGIVSHTVSFTKGCYTGQEFVARVHYREAAPPRRLVQVGFHPCAKPEAGDPMLLDDTEVGELTTVSNHLPLALGYLKRSVDVPQEGFVDGSPVCIGELPASQYTREPRTSPNKVSPLTLG
ncbi:MAG: YgfZ/GcvT domain-containing protein [Acidimicrobiia bacterium]